MTLFVTQTATFAGGEMYNWNAVGAGRYIDDVYQVVCLQDDTKIDCQEWRYHWYKWDQYVFFTGYQGESNVLPEIEQGESVSSFSSRLRESQGYTKTSHAALRKGKFYLDDYPESTTKMDFDSSGI